MGLEKNLNPPLLPFCPLLKGTDDNIQCRQRVTRYHFSVLCNTSNYGRCQFYAKIMRELDMPFAWLQRMAVEESDKAEGIGKNAR